MEDKLWDKLRDLAWSMRKIGWRTARNSESMLMRSLLCALTYQTWFNQGRSLTTFSLLSVLKEAAAEAGKDQFKAMISHRLGWEISSAKTQARMALMATCIRNQSASKTSSKERPRTATLRRSSVKTSILSSRTLSGTWRTSIMCREALATRWWTTWSKNIWTKVCRKSSPAARPK